MRFFNPRRSQLAVLFIAAVILLLACRTAQLISGTLPETQRAPAGSNPGSSGQTAPGTPKPRATRDPNSLYTFLPAGRASCKPGKPDASLVSGSITQNGSPVVGQRVQASSGPGAEPISDTPAESGADGSYQVTFVCNGKACDGAFWVWLVDQDGAQISPLVEFIFDNNCRVGALNFAAR